VGDAFTWAWNTFTRNAATLIVPALVYGLLFGVATAVIMIAQTMGGSGGSSYGFGLGLGFGSNVSGAGWGVLIIGYLISYAVTAFAQAGFLSGCLELADGRPVTIGSFFRPRNLGMAFLAALIVGVLTTIGYSLCFIPGLIVSIFTQFTILFVVERSESATKALSSSFSTVTSNIANALLIWLVCAAVAFVGALACGVGLLVAAPVAALVLTYGYRKLTGGDVVPLERPASGPQPM
jgi:uncharacterized membrane protein